MEASLLCPKCTLVPSAFFDPARAGSDLSEVADLGPHDEVKYIPVPRYDAVLIYARNRETECLTEEESPAAPEYDAKPEMFFVLRDLARCTQYNKILCSLHGGHLYLAIAQGASLMLANTYEAVDFTTAEYFIFLAVKSLHLNPALSTVCWRHAIGPEDEMSLCRYFRSVETV